MSTDITSARNYFTKLALSNYPSQHVGNLSKTAHKLIKTMQQGYVPPVDLGYKIILKLSDTYCAYFNRQVFTYLDRALTLDRKYELIDPKLMLQDY